MKHPDFKPWRRALNLLSPLRGALLCASLGATLASGCGPVEEADPSAPEPREGVSESAQTSAAVIYEHGNYQGASQSLAPGNYDVGALAIGNDQLSSLKVPAGWTVKLYRDAGFQGTVKSFTSDAAWVGDDFNDHTSSIQVISGSVYPPPQTGGFQLAAAPNAESLKYALASNPTIISHLARLANDLGYAWCGGTRSQYVGQDFDVYKDGNNYVMQAHYNPDDPYAGGYWADSRLKITLSNFKLLIDPSTLTYGAPLTESLDPIAVAQTYASNSSTTESTMGVKLTDQHTDSYTHTTSTSFTEGFKFSIKNKAEVPLFGSSELTTEFSFSSTQGWTDSNTTTHVTGVETNYSVRVPARSKKLITMIGYRTASQVYYSGLAYLSFDVTFHGFLRHSGNAHTSHPTNRPFHTVTFGGENISGLQDIVQQYDFRHIPNYSQWDWNWVNSFDSYAPSMMNFFRQGITAPITGRFSGVKGTYTDFREGEAQPL
ncbi:aerolysin family beta-barrel pore-forming toxin [Pyxidicoccus sp. 3LFB2]